MAIRLAISRISGPSGTGGYRDTVRRFWKGDGGTTGELASRLLGSSDLYQSAGRSPSASINFITAHDGFTLRDLVSYNSKHNLANGEDNRDGNNDNDSWNCGHEGPTDDPAIRELRFRQMKNFLASLALSQGIPMILAGDEFGHTQQGNNNVYCQDNELSWLNWHLAPEQKNLLEFARLVMQVRAHEPVFPRRRFFQGRPIHGETVKDIYWLTPDGREMNGEDWVNPQTRCFAVGFLGDQIEEPSKEGERIIGNTFLLFFNAYWEAISFRLGGRVLTAKWEVVFDTAHPETRGTNLENLSKITLQARSVVMLRLLTPLEA